MRQGSLVFLQIGQWQKSERHGTYSILLKDPSVNIGTSTFTVWEKVVTYSLPYSKKLFLFYRPEKKLLLLTLSL